MHDLKLILLHIVEEKNLAETTTPSSTTLTSTAYKETYAPKDTTIGKVNYSLTILLQMKKFFDRVIYM